jgi:hypothetical protein
MNRAEVRILANPATSRVGVALLTLLVGTSACYATGAREWGNAAVITRDASEATGVDSDDGGWSE